MNTTPTAARPRNSEGSHWYWKHAEAAYEVPRADGKGWRPTTLADARKLNLLPSVTTILKVLHRQALQDWLTEQAVLAVLSTPHNPEECGPKCSACGYAPLTQVDAFVHRVLQVERVQDQESQNARDLGTDIHAALECWFSGQEVPAEFRPWIEGPARAIGAGRRYVVAEKIVVGAGYAGRVDLIQETGDDWWLWDFKTTKTLPEPGESWPEHRLQLAAYAAAWWNAVEMGGVEAWGKHIKCANCYISTIESGKFVICEHKDWQATYNTGFRPLVEHWQWSTGYTPQQ